MHLPDGEQMSIYDAAMRYQADGVPLVVIAGKEYGIGQLARLGGQGHALLGVRAVIAESYERIHRINLVGWACSRCSSWPGDSAESLGLTGRETFTIRGLGELEVGERGDGRGGRRRHAASGRWPGSTRRPTSPSTARAGCCR